MVTGLVPEPSALYPLDSDRVVLAACFAPESGAAAAGWMALTEIPTNSVRTTVLASRGVWERQRTECVLSMRRQVQSGVVGGDTVISPRLYVQMCSDATLLWHIGVVGECDCERHRNRSGSKASITSPVMTRRDSSTENHNRLTRHCIKCISRCVIGVIARSVEGERLLNRGSKAGINSARA